MAKQILTGLDLLALPSLTTPKIGNVGFGAKSDGLYQKIGTVESKLSTTAELLDRVKTAVPANAKFTDTTYGVATTSANGLMSSADKTKLNGIATGANNYSLPTASSTVLGGVKIGSNISISSGVISVAAPYVHPSAHPISFITGLQSALDGKSATSHTHTFASLTNKPNSLSGYGITDAYTKAEVNSLANYVGRYDSSNGFLVKTDVARNENSMLILHIKGNSYGGRVPINTLVQVYNYVNSDAIIQTGALNNGYKINEVKAFYYNNLVYFWVPQQTNFMTMTFQLLKAEGQVNRVDSVTSAAVPTSGVEKMVTITPRTAWFEDTLTNVSQLSNDSGYITASASITGNAATATRLATARNINGTSFDGSEAITTARWGTARTLSFTGDVTGSSSVNGSANVATAMTLANSGVTAGTYRSVTVDAKGRVTAGTNPTTVTGYGLTDAVTTNTTQSITGTKTFTKRIGADLGIKIGTHSTDGLIEWDTTNNAFKFNGSLYATGEVSALGPGGSGSSGGVDMLDSWENYTPAKADFYVPASLLVPLADKLQEVLEFLQIGYWVHRTTGVKTYFGLDAVFIADGLLMPPPWAYDCSEVKIPLGVTELDYYCFYGCDALTSITLPEGLTSIGDSCFAECYALTSVNIPESVTSIGDECFSMCTSLTSITFPEGITSIGAYCFAWCESLTLVTVLPATPPTLGADVFYEVPSSFNIKVRPPYVNAYKTATNWVAYSSKISAI